MQGALLKSKIWWSKVWDTLTNKKVITDFKFNNSKNCCLAPFSTLNFDTLGKIQVCCYNNYFILGEYPKTTLKEAWFSPAKQQFINQITSLNLPKGCEICKFQILTKNFSNALFSKFDQFDNSIGEYPINLEFNFSFICNFECIMCGGKWSSSIRKNREKLPPLKSPYDDNFVEQLKEFLAHAKVINFLGGEPFLTPIYYRIWDILQNNNSSAAIYVTTNGSTLNEKVKKYLCGPLNMKVVLSLDSLDKKTYEFIRKNGNYEVVMSNLDFFLKSNKLASIAFCPMIQNVLELPKIALFCIKENIGFYINTVTKPLGGKIKGIHANENHNTKVWTGGNGKEERISTHLNDLIPEFCLSTLSNEKLSEIIENLKTYIITLDSNKDIQTQYVDFINSLECYKYNKPKNL